MNEKIFSKYIMNYEGNQIKVVLDNNKKETMFSYTFYNNNKEYLDLFENIALFVKPKKERTINNNLIINLDNFEVKYSSNNDKVNEEDLRLAMKILKNELGEVNPEIAKAKALLIKYNNDIKTLKELSSEGLDFEDEVKDLEGKIEDLKDKIEELIEE